MSPQWATFNKKERRKDFSEVIYNWCAYSLPQQFKNRAFYSMKKEMVRGVSGLSHANGVGWGLQGWITGFLLPVQSHGSLTDSVQETTTGTRIPRNIQGQAGWGCEHPDLASLQVGWD